MKSLITALILTAISSTALHAALIASDNAGDSTYNDGWTSADNGGSGFGAWSFTSSGGGSRGNYVGSSSVNGNGSSGNIDTSGRSFGLFAAPFNNISAIRGFSLGSLGAGQEFIVSLDNGFINSGASVGFMLQKSDGTTLFKFFFTGGQSFYQFDAPGGSGSGNTSVGFTTDGLVVDFRLGSSSAFSLSVNGNSQGSGTLDAGSISRVEFFNVGAGNGSGSDFFFNSIQVVPEPTNMALGVFGGLAICFVGFRRILSRLPV